MNQELLDYEYKAYKGRKRKRRPFVLGLLALIVWILVLIWLTTIQTKSLEDAKTSEQTPIVQTFDYVIGDVDKLAQEPVTYEDLFRQNGTVIDDCKITHYCAEAYNHICGNGDGLTATNVPVTPYWTCAVDPSVIPYGSDVMVDYGDRVEFWQAQDCGSAVKGNHIDLAVESHEEAMENGVLTATIYFMEVEREFN